VVVLSAVGIIRNIQEISMNKNAYFEMFAVEDKHWWYVGLHDLVVVLANKLSPQGRLKILDVGCGTGGLLSILGNAGHEVAGLDFSDVALDYCHKRNLRNVFKADINEWQPGKNKYDLITSLDVLSHEWIVDEVKILKSLANGLKDNGFIMLNYPAFPILRRQHDKVVMMRKRYTKKTLAPILSKAGLEPIVFSYRVPHAFFVLLLLRIHEIIGTNQKDTQSDIATIPSKFINNILTKTIKVENRAIARGVSIPLGSSLFVVARKIV
jgi:2-polyprenyl-3-methyl-5-hydroxy-6-metoxy-1,4-benzoquinol methylase